MLKTLLIFVLLTMQAAQPPQGTVRGVVVEDGSGAPVANARVSLTISGPPSGPARPRETMSDQEGRFAFTNVDAAGYMLQVSKAGFVQSAKNAVMNAVSLGNGEVAADIHLFLERAGAIEGRLVDASGEPIVRARVSVLRPMMTGQTPTLMPAEQPVETNDLGAFRVFGLSAGNYYVQASPRSEGPPSRTTAQKAMPASTYFPGVTNLRAAQAISVAAGQTVANIVVQMQSLPVYQISGVVVDESGSPVGDAMVNIMPDLMRPTQPSFTPSIRTGSNGEFTFINMFSGSYRISAALPVLVETVRPAGAAVPGGMPPPGVGGGVTAGVSGGVLGGSWSSTQTVNGVTTQYRSDGSAPTRLTIGNANVTDVRVVVRRPPPPAPR